MWKLIEMATPAMIYSIAMREEKEANTRNYFKILSRRVIRRVIRRVMTVHGNKGLEKGNRSRCCGFRCVECTLGDPDSRQQR